MSSLAELPELIGFFSYSREDDDAFKGTLSALRDAIQRELSAQLGRSKKTFRLFQDQESIGPGQFWETQIKDAVEQAVFFIPIVTPRMVNSHNCHFEFEAFVARERELGRSNLVFPILYISVPALENEAQWRNQPVLSFVGKRQWVDWRPFRHHDVQTTAVREAVERFCGKIVEALHEPWVSPEERQRQVEAEAQERAEAQHRQEEAEAKRRSDEEAALRRAEEEARQRQEELQAKREAEEDNRRKLEVEATQRAGRMALQVRDAEVGTEEKAATLAQAPSEPFSVPAKSASSLWSRSLSRFNRAGLNWHATLRVLSILLMANLPISLCAFYLLDPRGNLLIPGLVVGAVNFIFGLALISRLPFPVIVILCAIGALFFGLLSSVSLEDLQEGLRQVRESTVMSGGTVITTQRDLPKVQESLVLSIWSLPYLIVYLVGIVALRLARNSAPPKHEKQENIP